MIAKYDNNPSMIAIKYSLSDGNFFTFTNVTVTEIYDMLMKMECKNNLLVLMTFSVNYWKWDQHLLLAQ